MAKKKKKKEEYQFQEGNKAAEKWTKEIVIDTLNKMIELSTVEREIEQKKVNVDKKTEQGFEYKETITKVRRKVHLKKKLLIELKIWNTHWFVNMREKFKDDIDVSTLLGALDMICEINTYEDAANGSTNTAIAKMNLSTHYGWADSSKVEETVKEDESKIDLTKLSDDEVRQLIALNEKAKSGTSKA